MPNWCNTEYILRGEKENLEACARIINKFLLEDYPQKDRKYGTFQLVDWEIGGSLNSQDVRNNFEQAEIRIGSDGREYLQIWASTAWKSAHGTVEKLCTKFNLTYLYFSEEPGCEIYETNDWEGFYFFNRFIVEQSDAIPCHYETEQETLVDILNRTNRNCNDWRSAQEIIAEYNNKYEKDKITLIKIKIV
jgi:hypothetical protein